MEDIRLHNTYFVTNYYDTNLNVSYTVHIKINKDGSLVIHDVQHSDRGNYTCAVENMHGKDEISYAVNVRGNKMIVKNTK